MAKTKVKGLNITKKDILEAARAKALSYVVSPRKRKPLTAKERKAQRIYELASKVGGCQQEELLPLLDVLTGLPVSKMKATTVARGTRIQWEETKDDAARIIIAHGPEYMYLCLGDGDTVIDAKGIRNPHTTYSYSKTTKDEVNRFFDQFPENCIGKLLEGLIE